MRRIAPASCLLALLLVPAAAEAKTKGVFWQQSAAVPSRILDQIGFVPISGIQRPEDPPQVVKAGKTTYRVAWINALYGRRTTKDSLKELHRRAKFPPVGDGLFADAPLKGKWKRRFDVLADLARDADVLVVARDNPVCQAGLTRAQARGIARGEIKDWGAVGAPGFGAIKRRLIGTEGYAQPRFGAQEKPGRAVVRADGGVSEIAAGSAVAAVTAWSRVRSNSSVCAVPIDGVAPTAQAVFRREYKPAYAVQYVMHVKRRRDREGKAMVKAYVAFLKSAKATEMWRGTGMLMVADGEPAAGGGTGPGGGGGGASIFPAPSTDHAGRPITATRDDAGATAVMTGRRLQAGSTRLVFDGGGAFRELTVGESSCVVAGEAGWAVLEAWSYPENGGGWFARVRRIESGHEHLYEVYLPGDEPGTAYLGGATWTDDPGLAGSCV